MLAGEFKTAVISYSLPTSGRMSDSPNESGPVTRLSLQYRQNDLDVGRFPGPSVPCISTKRIVPSGAVILSEGADFKTYASFEESLNLADSVGFFWHKFHEEYAEMAREKLLSKMLPWMDDSDLYGVRVHLPDVDLSDGLGGLKDALDMPDAGSRVLLRDAQSGLPYVRLGELALVPFSVYAPGKDAKISPRFALATESQVPGLAANFVGEFRDLSFKGSGPLGRTIRPFAGSEDVRYFFGAEGLYEMARSGKKDSRHCRQVRDGKLSPLKQPGELNISLVKPLDFFACGEDGFFSPASLAEEFSRYAMSKAPLGKDGSPGKVVSGPRMTSDFDDSRTWKSIARFCLTGERMEPESDEPGLSGCHWREDAERPSRPARLSSEGREKPEGKQGDGLVSYRIGTTTTLFGTCRLHSAKISVFPDAAEEMVREAGVGGESLSERRSLLHRSGRVDFSDKSVEESFFSGE
jgi:hypothetical protein